MSQIQVSTETALRETMVESEQRRNRVMVLAQQLADATRENTELKKRLDDAIEEARETAERSEI